MQARDAHFGNPPKAFLLRKKGGGTKKKGASSGQIQMLTPKIIPGRAQAPAECACATRKAVAMIVQHRQAVESMS